VLGSAFVVVRFHREVGKPPETFAQAIYLPDITVKAEECFR
jgi:hypothetical protein